MAEEKKDIECEVSIAPLGTILCEIWKLQSLLIASIVCVSILIVIFLIVMLKVL